MEMTDAIRRGRPYGRANDHGTLPVASRVCWNKKDKDLLGVMGRLVIAVAVCTALASIARSQKPVLTRSYDNARTGANLSETTFTPRQVLAQGLTKRFSLYLKNDDPRIEAQPLYVPGITMNDGKKHDVVYVFSMSNNVWAFDANTGAQIWRHPVSLGSPFLPGPNDLVDPTKTNKSFGILSTPVIDQDAGIVYVVNWCTNDPNQQSRSLHVNALRLADGQRPPGKREPILIQASMTNTAGQVISLSQAQRQRAALLLVPLLGKPKRPIHKMLYVAFTGGEHPPDDGNPAHALHGWVVAFDVDSWKQSGAWVSTPSSFGGGIWQASQGPAADDHGFVYAMTANGGYVVNGGQNKDVNIGTTDFPESFVKLQHTVSPQASSLKLFDWFTPYRDSARKDWTEDEVRPFPFGYPYDDQDLGSAGPILPPETDLVVGAGKDGVLYVLDRNNLGKAVGDFNKLKVAPSFFTYDPDRNVAAYSRASADGNLDFKPMLGVKTHRLFGSPSYWRSSKHGPMLFAWGENGTLRAFSLSPSGQTRLLAHGAELASADLADPTNQSLGGMPGGMLTVSSNGQRAGIVWATTPTEGDASGHAVPGVVRAYDASEFAADRNPDSVPRLRKLWQSSGFTYSKFCPPVVADGKLFVPTYDGRIDVYALNEPGPDGAASR
jgi:outer membrane protein assembly factor BamB